MHLAFLNPQGNFDAADSFWTEHPDFGGQLVYVKELALALGRLGHRVDILTRRIEDPEWPQFAAAEAGYPNAPNVRIVRLPAGPPGFLAKESLWPHLQQWVDEIVAYYDDRHALPQLLTAHYGDGGYAAALLSLQSGIPFTFTGHSLGAQKLDKLATGPESVAALDERYRFASRIAAERIAMQGAGIIVTSTAQERYDQYGHPAYAGAVEPSNDAKFRVIPPGANLEIFHPEPDPADGEVAARIGRAIARDIAPARRELPLIIASSRLDPKKNVTGLVDAFLGDPALRERANLALAVRGVDDPLGQRAQFQGVEREILEQIAAAVTAAEAEGEVVSFPLNSQQELAAGYRVVAAGGGLFTLTAMYEPFGLAPLEAMAAGLPVVVTRNGGPSESLQEGEARYGILVDPADPADIARGLRALLEDAEAWKAMREAGLERIRSRYTWDRTAEGYLEAGQELLAGKGASEQAALPPDISRPPAEVLAPWTKPA